MQEEKQVKPVTGIMRVFLIAAGTISVGLAVVGAILPLIPTTPFLLLASFCYIRSSDKLYTKLINSKYLGEYIRNFQEGRGMPLKAKYVSIILLWASLIFSMVRFPKDYVFIIAIATGVGVTILILKIKTLKKDE